MNIYQHYKGTYYVILNEDARLEWLPELELIVYQSLENGKIWIRSKDEFHGWAQNTDGEPIKRFKLVKLDKFPALSYCHHRY